MQKGGSGKFKVVGYKDVDKTGKLQSEARKVSMIKS